MVTEEGLETRTKNAAKTVSLRQLLRGDIEVGFRVGEEGYADRIIMRKSNGDIYEVDGRSADRLDKLYRICEKLGMYKAGGN